MRVISGIRRGLKLKCVEGEITRPTTDRVKESVFNIIQMRLPAQEVLDLFAGSGALGIEALSRLSSHCVFVEQDKRAFSCIRENLENAKFLDNSTLILKDSYTFLADCSLAFDIIFLDPPYNKGMLYPSLDLISKNSLLKDDGIIVVETEKDGENPTHPSFQVVRRATYGKTTVTILERGGSK